MTDNLAYQEDLRTEMLNGKIVLMSPTPTVNHNRVAFNIAYAFKHFLRGKTCEAFADNTSVHLTEKDRVIPDVMIVCRKETVKRTGIFGAPDLVVEVLSQGTMKRDRGYKKDLYERCGVREYWIVDPEAHTVEAYLLSDGKFILDEIYKALPENIELFPDEKETYQSQVKVSLYDDFFIPLDEIFLGAF